MQYPTIPEIVGKAVIYFPAAEFPKPGFSGIGTLRGTSADDCTNRAAVEHSISTGNLGQGPSCGSGGCRVLRLDQYQADWTFEYGVPPNPLVVDAAASPPWNVTDSIGDSWTCGNDPDLSNQDLSVGQVVHEHGTYRFPYKTIGAAVFGQKGQPRTLFRIRVGLAMVGPF